MTQSLNILGELKEKISKRKIASWLLGIRQIHTNGGWP
jgi:hypothetical protein